jgi:hypothetical protein
MLEEGLFVSRTTGSGHPFYQILWIKTINNQKAILHGRFSRIRTLLWFGWKAFKTGKIDTFPGFVIRKKDISSWPFGKRISYELEEEIREQYRGKLKGWMAKGCPREEAV